MGEEKANSMESLNLVFTGKNRIELWREPVPEPGPGQLLVATQKTLISAGTECICFQRHFEPGTHWDNWVKYPFYPGYSNAGRVLQVGEGVTAFQPGDRVATRMSHRQYFVLEAERALKIPAAVSNEEATWFGLAGIVQNGVRRAEHELGDKVVVIGLGPLGQLVVQYTRLMGAWEVIALDPAEQRLQKAAEHGATHTLDLSAEEAFDAVAELTEGRMADVVYDVTGHAAVFPAALRLARKFGKVLLLGDTGFPSQQHLTADVITRGLRIIGAHDSHPPATVSDYAYWTHANMARLFFTYLQRGQMRVGDLITHRFSPEEAAQAYHLLTTDRAPTLGVIFDWTRMEGVRPFSST